jgi:uncharacterized membrane protein YgcG
MLQMMHPRPGESKFTFSGIFLVAVLSAILLFSRSSQAVEMLALQPGINDFAGMMPAASMQDLQQRLLQFRSRTGYSVVVLTLSSVGDQNLEKFGRDALNSLPLQEQELQRTALLIVARKERRVSVQSGSELQALFPEPAADQKLQAHVSLYFDGFRPDLGIYSGVNYIFRVITGDVRVGSTTEEEKLENTSIAGRGAGAIFTLCLGPYLALVAGMLWGLYSTTYRVQCATRVLIGAVLGSGVAKGVAVVMVSLGSYGYDLWYFILAGSILLGGLGSLTEFWMRGDWCAIPRVKDKVKRKPEDNMGI